MWRICLTSIPIHCVNVTFFFIIIFACCLFLSIVFWDYARHCKSWNQKQIKQNNCVINGTLQPSHWILVFTFRRSLVSNKTQRILSLYDFKRNWENPLKLHMNVLATSIVLCALETTAVNVIHTTSGRFLLLVVLCTCVVFLKKIFSLELLKLSESVLWSVSKLHNNIGRSSRSEKCVPKEQTPPVHPSTPKLSVETASLFPWDPELSPLPHKFLAKYLLWPGILLHYWKHLLNGDH